MTDRGHAAVELALAVAVLLLPVALAVLSFGPWSETRVLAEAVAAEASRAAVLAADQAAGRTVAMEVAANQAVAPDEMKIGWCGASPAPVLASLSGDCLMARGTDVTVEVLLWTPLIQTPWGPVGGVWVAGSHSEPVDLYRSLE